MTYSQMDLYQIIAMMDSFRINAQVDNVDVQTVVSTYDGHTIFSILENKIKMLESIQDKIFEREFPEEEDEIYKLGVENNIMRRLFYILRKPTLRLNTKMGEGEQETVRKSKVIFVHLIKSLFNSYDDGSNDIRFNSVLYRALWRNGARYKECFIQLANRCEQNEIGSFITCVEDL